MKKKILCLLLTLVLIFAAALTGCAGKNTAVATQALLSAAEQVQKDGNYNSFTADVKVSVVPYSSTGERKEKTYQYILNQKVKDGFPEQDMFEYIEESNKKSYNISFDRLNGYFSYHDTVDKDSTEFDSVNLTFFEKRFETLADGKLIPGALDVYQEYIGVQVRSDEYFEANGDTFTKMANYFTTGLMELLEPSVSKNRSGDVTIKIDGKKFIEKLAKTAEEILAYAKKNPSKTVRDLFFDERSPGRKLVFTLIGNVNAKEYIEFYDELLKGYDSPYSTYLPKPKDETETLYEYFCRLLFESQGDDFANAKLSDVYDVIRSTHGISKRQLEYLFPGKLDLELTIDKNGVFKAMKTNFRFVNSERTDVTVEASCDFNIPVTITDISELRIMIINEKVKDYDSFTRS